MKLHANQKTQKPIPPSGANICRCYAIVDLGTQMESYLGSEPKPTRKVHFSWEIPDQMHVFDQAKGAQPLGVFQEFTASLGDKAKLKKVLCSWRNVADMKDVKLEVFLGKPCIINVTHRPEKAPSLPAGTGLKKDGYIYYGNFNTIMPLMEGMVCKPAINPTLYFSLDHFSWETFNRVPKYLQDTIARSQEWSGINAKFGNNPLNSQSAQQSTQHSASAIQPNTDFTQESSDDANW